jgi:transcriptional regulator with XRE-family HTH domain
VKPTSQPDRVTEIIIELISRERKRQSLTYEELATRAGIDRSTVALWERGERTPRLDVLLKVCQALGVELSTFVTLAEAIASGSEQRTTPVRPPRKLEDDNFTNEDALKNATGLSSEHLRRGINHCHQTLDTIDFQLELHGARPISRLVELANLSSMIGNLLAEGIATGSGGQYGRNAPHSYPDLIPLKRGAVPLELKMALETNRPKGHLPKGGVYLTFRYVLCDSQGVFKRGKSNRGERPYIWEARVGKLTVSDFDISNTAGDSGKTAVIKTTAFRAMSLVYFNPALLPYARISEDYR